MIYNVIYNVIKCNYIEFNCDLITYCAYRAKVSLMAWWHPRISSFKKIEDSHDCSCDLTCKYNLKLAIFLFCPMRYIHPVLNTHQSHRWYPSSRERRRRWNCLPHQRTFLHSYMWYRYSRRYLQKLYYTHTCTCIRYNTNIRFITEAFVGWVIVSCGNCITCKVNYYMK